jgi:hypothetical protein
MTSVPSPCSPQVGLVFQRVEEQPVLGVAHEVALMTGEVEGGDRLGAIGDRRGLVTTEPPEPVVDLVDVGIQRRWIRLRHQRRDRDVGAQEDRRLGGGKPHHFDLEGLILQATGAQRGEATQFAGVVGPRFGCQDRSRNPIRRGHGNRRVGVPDLLGAWRGRRRQRTQARVGQPVLWTVALLRAHGLERDAPPAPLGIAIRGREPVAEQVRRANAELLMVHGAARRRLGVHEASGSKGTMERGHIGRVQPSPTELMPARGQDAECQPQVVDLPVRPRSLVVGGVEEVGDPPGRAGCRDRRTAHLREPPLRAAVQTTNGDGACSTEHHVSEWSQCRHRSSAVSWPYSV